MRLIDGDALQDKMHDECCGECESCKKYIWNGERSLCGLIDEAPTVPLPDFKEGYKQAIRDGKTNFSRPQGKWIKKVDDVGFISYICSNCGFELELEDCSDSHYCTICGADMEVIKND